MCSTTRSQNGFRHRILAVALSGQSLSLAALRNSLLSVAAYHCRGPGAAISYKISAMKCLYESLATSSGCLEDAEAQLATSMMLCMYSVFDEREAQFQVHLEGAKRILYNLQRQKRHHPVSDFLLQWVLYYDVLSRFTLPHQVAQDGLCLVTRPNEEDSDLTVGSCLPGNPESSCSLTSTKIIGLLGCSLEVIESLSFINHMRATILASGFDHDSCRFLQHRIMLESRLIGLCQCLSDEEVLDSTPTQIRHATVTAELYRLATLLYLQRVVPSTGDEIRRATYLHQMLSALETIQVATSPWPIFIAACEATKEEERAQILDVLDRMDKVRNVGNVRVLYAITEMVWKQQDLRGYIADDHPKTMQWWLCIENNVPAPWFA